MRVDKLKRVTDFRDEVAISRAIAVAQSQPTPMDIGAVGKGKSGKGGKGSKGAGKRNSHIQQACSRKCGKVDHLAKRVSIFWNSSAQGQGWSEGQGRWQRCTCCQDLLELWRSSQCPKKKVHAVEESTTASQAGSQDTIMVGPVGSYFDVGSVSEVTFEPRKSVPWVPRMCVEGNPLTLRSIQVLE